MVLRLHKRKASRATGLIRRVTPTQLEVRAASDGQPLRFSGYAALFNSYSHILWDYWEGAFVEEIAPGAFAKTLQEADVRLLINHDPNLILARNKAGTLTLVEDERGLLATADIAPTTVGQDIAISLARGDISQMSFAFRPVKDRWSTVPTGPYEGLPLRTLIEVSLQQGDVSVVTYPAYEETEAGLDEGGAEESSLSGEPGEVGRARQFYGLARSLGLTDLAPEQRNALLTDLARGRVDPTRLPMLRAAHEALGALLQTFEPMPPPTEPDHSPIEPVAVEEPRHSGVTTDELRLRLLKRRPSPLAV